MKWRPLRIFRFLMLSDQNIILTYSIHFQVTVIDVLCNECSLSKILNHVLIKLVCTTMHYQLNWKQTQKF